MSQYVTVPEFRTRSVMPGAYVDELEIGAPGFLQSRLVARSSFTDRYLGRRFPVPFDAPYPEAVLDWVTRLVTPEAYQRRGVDPSDLSMQAAIDSAARAEEEIRQAANGEMLIDFYTEDKRSRITKGAPLMYSETSPYVARDIQRSAGRLEDRNRRGT
jgi:hypothetical protein